MADYPAGFFNLILLCSKVLKESLALGAGGMMGQDSLLSDLKPTLPAVLSWDSFPASGDLTSPYTPAKALLHGHEQK